MATVLIVGYGSAGKRHAHNVANMGHHVLSYDPNVRPRPLGGVASYADGLKLATHVMICSPARFHAEQAILALQAGKQVFVEKPLAWTVAEGDTVCNAANDAGKVVAVGYQFRAYKPLVQLQAKLRDHAWDDILLRYHGDRHAWPGSCYEDLLLECSHEIDLAAWLCAGLARRLVSVTMTSETAVIEWRGPARRRVVVDLNWAAVTPRREWSISGVCKRYRLEFCAGTASCADDLATAYRDEVVAWLDGRPICTAQDGLAVLRDIDAIRQKAQVAI